MKTASKRALKVDFRQSESVKNKKKFRIRAILEKTLEIFRT